MTLHEALTEFSSLRRGVPMSDGELTSFINELELTVKNEIFDTHEGESADFSPYTEEDGEKTLLVPAPYDVMYLRYLEMMSDYRYGDGAAYNNAAAMFSAAYSSFRNHYNSTHMPKCERMVLTP